MKAGIEGPFFVYNRSTSPSYGFILLNRLTPRDFSGFITPSHSLLFSDNFLIYKDDSTGTLQ
jgi:hypothetical protein